MLYMRLDDEGKTVDSMPFCEAFDGINNVRYNRDQTQKLSEEKGVYTVCFTADKDTEKNKNFMIPVSQLATMFQATIYENKQKILNLAVQPEGELLVQEVQQLIEP